MKFTFEYFFLAEYKETLFEHVAPEQLPAFLGGNLKDPDGNPRCPSRVSM